MAASSTYRKPWRMCAAIAIFATAGLTCASFIATAAPVQTGHVEAELVAERGGLSPGKTTTVALRLKMQRGWHTYWQNPGEAGLATTIAWTLPAGIAAGPILWPPPRALPTGPLVSYGYEGDALLLTEVAVAPGVAVGVPVTLAARANWLVCKETCIPESADLTLALAVGADASAATALGLEPIAKRARRCHSRS